jgi:two-component system, NtrC family, sensor kinase
MTVSAAGGGAQGWAAPLRRARGRWRRPCLSLGTKLMLSFLAVITLMSAVFLAVGVQIIEERVVQEAHERVANDLNAARDIYHGEQRHVTDVVRLTAERFFLRDALAAHDIAGFEGELHEVMFREGLGILTVTDARGDVVLRVGNPPRSQGSLAADDVVAAVLATGEPAAGTAIVPTNELRRESGYLLSMAQIDIVDTPLAAPLPEKSLRDGMMIKAAAPIASATGEMVGVLVGGVLLNRSFGIVDKIKATLYQGAQYRGKDIGTATIFQGDVRIATNVVDDAGFRAVGTRVSEQVFDRVAVQGKSWIGRAFVVNDWYISAYEPIRNIRSEVIGILYVGLLEAKYTDIRHRMVVAFAIVMAAGVLAAIIASYFVSRRITLSLGQLVHASHAVAAGNLDAQVAVCSNDEIGELAATFNAMADALRRRDEQLQELTRTRVMKSERLGMIGQLAAGVAHEINNPMQGIVTYAMLLLEDLPEGDPNRESLEKIVAQANRCTKIVRGLLDFSRAKSADRKPFDITRVIEDCVGLVGRQALFQNIEVAREYQPDAPPVIVDPSQLQQVFLNLILNAAEAMDGNGRLTLRTVYRSGAEFVTVQVADTGHGIQPDDLEKVFAPFFTTKETGRGTGLGLAICYGIVKEHKGTISVDSTVGEGTTFTVTLPIRDDDEGGGDGQPE